MKFLVAAILFGLLAGALAVVFADHDDLPQISGDAPGYTDRAAAAYTDGSVIMPVVGVDPRDLVDTYRAERSGRRSHLAIDIFAPRGTPTVALTDGTLERIGQNALGGNVIWLRSTTGRYAFYYAHLDAFAPGLREGQQVARGDTLGTVGTTGNARSTPPHLHLQMVLRTKGKERTLNPYPLLRFLNVGRRAAERAY